MTDSVPFAARGFLLALVAGLHIAGAAALLRLSALPQHDEESVILRASWIAPPPLSLPPPVAHRPPPLPSPPRTVASPAPVPAVVETPVAPVEPVTQEDSIPAPPIDVSAAATATGETVKESHAEPDFDAGYFSNPEPPYPALSRRLREQGLVKLRVHVTAGGYADEVTLHTSSGYGRLDKTATDAVKHWRFRLTQRGTPVAGWVIVPVRFELKS